MVLCLVTLTDLKMCRAGLSASAELLVKTNDKGTVVSTLLKSIILFNCQVVNKSKMCLQSTINKFINIVHVLQLMQTVATSCRIRQWSKWFCEAEADLEKIKCSIEFTQNLVMPTKMFGRFCTLFNV